ncbi:MAG: AraC family transcriptional regulator [bacterium]
MPTAECISLFHILVEGQCWVELRERARIHMDAGDLIIFPRGDQHVLASDLSLSPTPMASILPSPSARVMQRLVHGGGGAQTRFVCGFLHCDQKFNPLLGALPPVLCVRSREDSAVVEAFGDSTTGGGTVLVPRDASSWIGTTLRYSVREATASRLGNQTMLARLAELLFVEVLRRYTEQLPAGGTGWLAGLSDPQVGRALRLLHAEPARAWTVEELGRAAGVSRSALAQRFRALIGESPMRYLTGWRMQLARQLLREGGGGLADVAAHVGYESEAAFNRAFRRHMGQPPATWRNQNYAADPGARRPTRASIPAAVASRDRG